MRRYADAVIGALGGVALGIVLALAVLNAIPRAVDQASSGIYER